jgi:hypothetical protein
MIEKNRNKEFNEFISKENTLLVEEIGTLQSMIEKGLKGRRDEGSMFSNEDILQLTKDLRKTTEQEIELKKNESLINNLKRRLEEKEKKISKLLELLGERDLNIVNKEESDLEEEREDRSNVESEELMEEKEEEKEKIVLEKEEEYKMNEVPTLENWFMEREEQDKLQPYSHFDLNVDGGNSTQEGNEVLKDVNAESYNVSSVFTAQDQPDQEQDLHQDQQEEEEKEFDTFESVVEEIDVKEELRNNKDTRELDNISHNNKNQTSFNTPFQTFYI